MNNLQWLQEYYLSCCNEDWEHSYGIKIDTLDNPGWRISIDLRDLELEDVLFEEVSLDRTEHDWIRCEIRNYIFEGHGGPLNLDEILGIFRKWVESFDAKKQ